MSGLILVLSLAGLVPASFLPKSVLPPTEHVWIAPAALQLGVDLAGAAANDLDDLGRAIGRGVVVGPMHVGIGGVPGSPFVSNFMHAHEIRLPDLRMTEIDPETLASNLMLQASFALD